MDLVQTKPVDGDAVFAAIRENLNPLLAKRGHPMIEETGSVSWQYGAGYPKPKRRKTLFKLLNLPSGAIVFAIREDFLAAAPNLAGLPWPHHFAVKPHLQVAFKGFEIKRDDQDSGVKRVERILQALPKLAVEIKLKTHDSAREAEFDRKLAALKESDGSA
jgi:hypothetical protein